MAGKKVKFSRTEAAAKSDRLTKWDLIAAIAEDAVDADIAISGAESIVAAATAFAVAGSEYADATVKSMCMLAKFDYESTAQQRKVWRRYPWSNVREVVAAGWSPSAAASLLDGDKKTRDEILKALKPTRKGAQSAPGFDARCAQWVQRANKLMMEGADLMAEAGTLESVGSHAEMALAIYAALAERHMDAEIRRFFETEAAR